MEFSDRSDDRLAREELVQAFQLIDKWSHVDQFNSMTGTKIFVARCAIQTAIEYLNSTESELEEAEKEEQKELEDREDQDQESQEQYQELVEAIDQILDGLCPPQDGGEGRGRRLTAGQTRIVADAVQQCLSNRPLSHVEATFIVSLLREYRTSL